MKPIQRVRLFALLSSIAGTASAQAAPAAPAPAPAPVAPAPAPVAPAPAPAPAVPAPAPAAAPAVPAPAPAPAPYIEPPLPASTIVPPVASDYPTEPPPPPPAPPTGPSRDDKPHFAIGAAWDVAFPLGSLHDFTPQVSGLGFEFLVRYFALPQLSIGASTDFQTFTATKPRTTYAIDNGALTATAFSSVQNAAVRASVHYYLLQNGPVVPYAGANIGVGWSTFQTSAADLVIYDSQTSILLGADVGALFPLSNSSLALMTALRYSALPSAEFLNVTNVQSLSLQFGLLTL